MLETAEAEVKTEKVFDLKEGKYVDKPIEGTPGINEKRSIFPTPEEEEEIKKAKETTSTEEELAAKTIADKVITDKAAADKLEVDKKASETEIKFEPGSYIKEKFGEKFGIESEEDLNEILEAQDKLVKIVEDAQAKAKELEKKEPEYRTDQEKKIAEFLKPFDPSRFGEGLNTVAEIMVMDPATVSGKKAMEEAYIIQHPELTREEAKEIFVEDVWNKFQLNKDDFDTDEAYTGKKKIADIRLKSEEANARKVLTEKKEQLKAAPVKEKEQEKPFEIPAESITTYSKEVEKFFQPEKNKVYDRFNYLSDDGKEILATVVFDKEKIEDAKKFMDAYVKNPMNYNKNGKISNFKAQELVKQYLRIEHGDWIEDQLWKQVKVVASKLKAEQIAGTTPDKKSIGGGDVKLGVSEQFAELAKKEREKRQR